MKRREKAQTNQASKAATAGFVALAALLLYGALRLSGQIVTRELHQTPQPQASGLIELADPVRRNAGSRRNARPNRCGTAGRGVTHARAGRPFPCRGNAHPLAV